MSTHEREAIVVTGMGVISALGFDVDTYWSSLLAGRSGIKSIDRFDTEGLTSTIAGQIDGFDGGDYMDPKESRRHDLYTRYAVAAGKLAVADAGLSMEATDPSRVGIIIGSGIGGMTTIENQTRICFERGPRRVSPFMIPALISNMAAGLLAIEIGARGPNYGVVSACATSAHALGESLDLLRLGRADVMIAGGSEAAITQIGYAGFCSMKAMSTSFNDEPQRSSRPFDAKRDGFVMGEGAGVLVLERRSHAEKRGATILAELAGYSATCDAFHITMPDPEGKGLSECMTQALADAGVEREEVGYVNAHGTSTPYNDKFETAAIKRVFGEAHAKGPLKVSSTKSMTGHLLGAAGSVEAIACIQAIRNGALPPTINYEEPDPECDLNYVPNEMVEQPVDVAVSNNLGFGGHNVSLVFRRA